MAITVNQKPSTISSYFTAWNSLYYQFQSDETAQTGFKFVVTIKDVIAVTDLVVLDALPLPGQIYTYIDISELVASHLTADQDEITDLSNTVKPAPTSWKKIDVSIQEYYSGALQGSPILTGQVFIWNAAFGKVEWLDNSKNGSFYVIVQSQNTGFLTPSPDLQATAVPSAGLTTYPLYDDQKLQLRFNCSTLATAPTTLNFATYNAAFTQIDAQTKAIATPTNRFTHYFTIQKSNMGFISFTGAAYLRVTTNNGNYMRLFRLVGAPCDRFANYDLLFYNRLGGFDSWVFERRSQRTTNIERNSYTRTWERVGATSVTNSRLDLGNTQFETRINNVYSINSGFVTPQEVAFLLELAKSPLVFWNNGGVYQRVRLTGENYEHFTANSSNVRSLNFEMMLDYNEMTQRL